LYQENLATRRSTFFRGREIKILTESGTFSPKSRFPSDFGSVWARRKLQRYLQFLLASLSQRYRIAVPRDFVDSCFCRLVFSLTRVFIDSLFHQLVFSSTCVFIDLCFDQLVFSSTHVVVNTCLHWHVLSSTSIHQLVFSLTHVLSTLVFVDWCVCQLMFLLTYVFIDMCFHRPVFINTCFCRLMYLSTHVFVDSCICQHWFSSIRHWHWFLSTSYINTSFHRPFLSTWVFIYQYRRQFFPSKCVFINTCIWQHVIYSTGICSTWNFAGPRSPT
jgi:hypothetical protein